MLCGVGAALIAAPFSSGFIHDAFLFDVIVALAIVAFAAITNPFQFWGLLGDAILCALVVILFEIDAFDNYQRGELVTFVMYEAIAVLFIIAFYFSLKTIRAFSLHQIGRRNTEDDFAAAPHSKKDPKHNSLEAEESYTPDFLAD